MNDLITTMYWSDLVQTAYMVLLIAAILLVWGAIATVTMLYIILPDKNSVITVLTKKAMIIIACVAPVLMVIFLLLPSQNTLNVIALNKIAEIKTHATISDAERNVLNVIEASMSSKLNKSDPH